MKNKEHKEIFEGYVRKRERKKEGVEIHDRACKVGVKRIVTVPLGYHADSQDQEVGGEQIPRKWVVKQWASGPSGGLACDSAAVQ